MNIYDKDLSKCIGCNNCANICTKGAIILEENQDGFIYPKIDLNKCTNCGMCIKKCPIDQQNPSFKFTPKIKIIKAKNSETLFAGSSGGFFPTIAQYLLNNGWIVYGAIYDNIQKKVIHVNTENTPLHLICRSKYTQSYLNDSFKQIRSLLKTGKEILFVGTPCQVAALYLYIGERPQNLITLDFICHGVASSGYFTKMIEHWQKEQNKNITNITYREKLLGWRHLVMKATFDDSTYAIKDYSSDYYYAFTHNYSIRKCCFKCNFPRRHQADISMGDAWHKKDKEDTGLSIISINTLKGEKLFASTKNQFNIEDDSIDSWNINDAYHNYNPKKYDIFFKQYKRMNIEDLNKWLNKKQHIEKYIDHTRVLLGKFKQKLIHLISSFLSL